MDMLGSNPDFAAGQLFDLGSYFLIDEINELDSGASLLAWTIFDSLKLSIPTTLELKQNDRYGVADREVALKP